MLKVVEHGPVCEVRMATGFLGRGLYWVSAFYLDGVLIDAGPPRTAPELARWLHSRPLEAVLNTHHHEDHVGGDVCLPLAPLAPAAALQRMAHPERVQVFRRLAWGQPQPVQAHPLPPTFETRRVRLEIIPTPGHSDDHVVFLEPDRGWVFTGDLFIHERIRYAQADEDVLVTLASIHSLLQRDFGEVYCGHAGRVRQGKEALRRKAQFLEDVRGQALALREDGLSEEQIARRIFGKLGRWHWVSGGWFSEVHLVRQLMRDGHAS